MLAHNLLHEYKRAFIDMRRNYAVCLFRRITMLPDVNVNLGYYITLIPYHPQQFKNYGATKDPGSRGARRQRGKNVVKALEADI
jgi:hypothetical protein